MSGVVTREAGAETFEANIRYTADRLAKEDIVGLIEPISPQAVPGYFLNDYQYGEGNSSVVSDMWTEERHTKSIFT